MAAAFLRKYATGTGADVYVPMIKRGVVDYAVGADWTPAAGDVKVSIDGGAAASIGTLPVAVAMGNTAYWKFVLSDSELTGKKMIVTVADSATKAVEDQAFDIETFGNASAMYVSDLAAAGVVVTTNNDKTGYALSTGGVQALWDALTSALTTSGSIGKRLADDIDATITSRMATFTLPTNFSSLVIDSTGRVNAFLIGILTSVFTEGAAGRIAAAFKQFFNIASPAATMDHGVLVDTVTTYTGNTVQTGDAYAVANSRLPAALTANGNIKSSLVEILTTALTETSGQLAGGFKKFFNIATPAATMDHGILTDTTTTLTNAPSDSSGVTTLLSRLSALRAGYLDNLSAGAVALEASLQGLITTIGASAAGVATAVWAAAVRTVTAATNITSTGGTTVPQTGDSYARIGANGASLTAVPWNSAADASVTADALAALDTILADSIPADGTRPTVRQSLYMLTQFMTERAISGTTVTVKKPDGSTTLFTLTLNDGTAPTSITRAS